MAMHRSEQLIYQRRAQQQKLSNLQTKLRQQFHEKEFARWENKGTDVQKANQMRLRLKQLRDASMRNLDARRQQLAILLEKEQAQYQQEIVGSQQTPEQVRQRMAERVKQLKEERQSQRKEYVNQQLYRRFEMNADELRKVDAELRELKTDYERNVQLIEKQRVMENQYEEQMLFAELGRRQLQKKQAQQREKVREQQEKVNERNAILAIQKEMKDQKAKKDKELTEAQRQMLKQEWERDRQSQKIKDQQLQAKSKEIAKDLIESNQRQRKLKEEIARREKQADKQMIQRIIEKEQLLAELEREHRVKYRQQARKTLSSFKNRTQDMIGYEKELDRLIEIERKKKQAKQDEEWNKRENARVKLLYDVYGDRERKVRQHMKERQNELQIKGKEKIAVEESVRRQNQIEEEKRRKQVQINKKQQAKLLEEIRMKEERRRQLLMELQREDNEITAARQQYDQKIQERKEKGRAELDTFKRTHRL